MTDREGKPQLDDIHGVACVACGQPALTAKFPCSSCGGRKFLISFNEPMLIRGGGSVEFPISTRRLNHTVIKTTGTAEVRLGTATRKLLFANIRAKLKDRTHFLVLRTKIDRKTGDQYLDVLFGPKGSGLPHSHFGRRVDASGLFAVNRIDADMANSFHYARDTGAVLPLQMRLEDPTTGRAAILKFGMRRNDGLVDLLELGWDDSGKSS